MIKKINQKKKPKLILLSIIVILCLLQGIKIYIQNELAIEDYEYTYALTKIKDQIRDNFILHEEILHDEALTTISQEARKGGFVPAKYIFL